MAAFGGEVTEPAKNGRIEPEQQVAPLVTPLAGHFQRHQSMTPEMSKELKSKPTARQALAPRARLLTAVGQELLRRAGDDGEKQTPRAQDGSSGRADGQEGDWHDLEGGFYFAEKMKSSTNVPDDDLESQSQAGYDERERERGARERQQTDCLRGCVYVPSLSLARSLSVDLCLRFHLHLTVRGGPSGQTCLGQYMWVS